MPDLLDNLKTRIDLRNLDRVRFEAIDRGELLLPWTLRPCRMKILFVVDGFPGNFLNVTYGRLYFSLSAVIDLLANSPDWWVKYDVTKAHRQTDPLGAADIEGFRFDTPGFDLNAYDQVWFFGARSNIADALRLSDAELEILSRWMDERDGGVFATGDHDDLGASLCGRVPRVRSMRKWATAQNPPQPTGVNRHDTLRRGHDNFYTFNDESDDIPMTLRVRRYALWSSTIFQRRWAPHPILCGKNGVIDVLPDHPHEGEVIEPTNPAADFSFGTYINQPEYPVANGHQELPQIIAWARVQGDHTEGRNGQPGTDRNKGLANAKEFGAIGAYDGHQGGVGRVVVDSTWHHWFDVNLIGRPAAVDDIVDSVQPGDPKSFGFEFSPAGRAEYARIKEYFLNIAKWLGSPAKQRCMWFRAMWGLVIRYPLNEQLSPRLPLWELGGIARDAIGRKAGRCVMYSWILPEFAEWKFLLPPDILRPGEELPNFAGPNWEAFETYVLGGITREFLELAYSRADNAGEMDERAAAKAFATGISAGSRAFVADYSKSLKSASADLKKLEVISKKRFDPKAFGH